jgi:hypothetical protein
LRANTGTAILPHVGFPPWLNLDAVMEAVMRCHFCKQDVDNPCQTTQQVQRRAIRHIDHCEHALKSQQGMVGRGAR